MADRHMQQPNTIGQLSIEFYTVILLGFSISSSISHEVVVDTLNRAVLTLTNAFPFLAGQVVIEGKDAQHSGTYRIVPYEHHDRKSSLRVKDCTDLYPSFEDFAKAKAPASMLDGNMLAPMKGLPAKYDPVTDTSPVFIVQANFVKGGLLLCFSCQHNMIDMNGQGKLIHSFARACRGEAVSSGSLNAEKPLPLLKDGEVQLPHDIFRCPSRLTQQEDHHDSEHVSAPWRYYRFPKGKLVELKQLATQAEGDVPWISTNDALTAFIWQRVSSARLSRLSPDASTKTMRMVNALNRLSPPVQDHFIGMLPTITSLSIQEVVGNSLSSITNTLRRTLFNVDDHYVRSWTTLIHSLNDRTTINPAAAIKPGNDLIVSSWADLGLSSCDFGEVLGKPVFVRRPRMGDCEGLTYLMPRTEEGDIYIIISLREDDFARLEADEVWLRFTEKIG